MATLSFTEQDGRGRVLGRSIPPTWQRATIGSVSGVMPVAVSLAVVQAAPVMDAVGVLLYGGRDGGPATANAKADDDLFLFSVHCTHLSFSVDSPISTSTRVMIQKRTMTRGSGQPFSSK